MSDDGDETQKMSRRGFLSGAFLFRGSSEEEAGSEGSAEGAGGPSDPPTPPALSDEWAARNTPATRGPAVDLQAILGRAEAIAGVSDEGYEEAPAPWEKKQTTDTTSDTTSEEETDEP